MPHYVVGRIYDIPVSRIRRYEGQPRKRFQQDKLRRLGASMKKAGQVVPIRVMVTGDGWFDLIAGERRWLAAQMVGMATLRAEIAVRCEDNERFLQSVLENSPREDLTPLELAQVCRRWLNEKRTPQEIGELLGIHWTYVYHMARLLDLHPTLQEYLDPDRDDDSRLKVSVAYELSRLAKGVQLSAFASMGRFSATAQEARFVVDRLLSEGARGNPNVVTRPPRPSERFTSLEKFVDRIIREAEAWSERGLDGMLTGQKAEALLTLGQRLERAQAALRSIGKSIEDQAG